MNWSQTTGILRILVPSAISFAVAKGWVTENVVEQAGGALAAIVAAGGWSAVANTNLSLSKAVAGVQGLTVHADSTAPPEIQTVALTGSVPDIVPAAPPPFVSSTIQQRR